MELDNFSRIEANCSKKLGICETMCPKAEMKMRESEGLLHPFEVMEHVHSSSKRPQADVTRMVKQYSRSAAGQSQVSSSDLRPFPVLRDTVKYLFKEIVPVEHLSWTVVYEFVFDRLRAVRQDMVIQEISGHEAIFILEQVIRFHVYAAYRLRDAKLADFDPVINKQHLLECLKRLLYLYQICPGIHESREEFECIYLLDNLGDHHAITHCLHLDPPFKSRPSLKLCLAISTSFLMGNYTRCLKLARQLTSVLLICALIPQLDNLRINLLHLLCVAYHVKSHPAYPVEKLKAQLDLSLDSDVLNLCARCSLIDSFVGSGIICFDKTKFSRPQQSHGLHCYKSDRWLLQVNGLVREQSVTDLLLHGESICSTNAHKNPVDRRQSVRSSDQHSQRRIGESKVTLDGWNIQGDHVRSNDHRLVSRGVEIPRPMRSLAKNADPSST